MKAVDTVLAASLARARWALRRRVRLPRTLAGDVDSNREDAFFHFVAFATERTPRKVTAPR
jgi:hypothetical protein